MEVAANARRTGANFRVIVRNESTDKSRSFVIYTDEYDIIDLLQMIFSYLKKYGKE